MKATEVAVEQLLTGLLIVAVLGIPLVPGDPGQLLGNATRTAGTGLAVLAAAYLLGVVFDKLGDMLLSRLEQRIRLAVAMESLQRGEVSGRHDLFPEDLLRAAILYQGGSASAEWIDYLRGRMRITRGLVVFTPALGVSVAIRVAWEPHWLSGVLLALLVSAYAAALWWSQGEDLPRTDDPDFRLAARAYLEANAGKAGKVKDMIDEVVLAAMRLARYNDKSEEEKRTRVRRWASRNAASQDDPDAPPQGADARWRLRFDDPMIGLWALVALVGALVALSSPGAQSLALLQTPAGWTLPGIAGAAVTAGLAMVTVLLGLALSCGAMIAWSAIVRTHMKFLLATRRAASQGILPKR